MLLRLGIETFPFRPSPPPNETAMQDRIETNQVRTYVSHGNRTFLEHTTVRMAGCRNDTRKIIYRSLYGHFVKEENDTIAENYRTMGICKNVRMLHIAYNIVQACTTNSYIQKSIKYKNIGI